MTARAKARTFREALTSTLRVGLLSAASLFAAGAASAEAAETASPADFANWLQGFKAEAVAAGVFPAIVDDAFQGVTVNQRVFELNDNQPEFSKSIWTYLDSAVSETRVANGLKNKAANSGALAAIEAKYGVDAETIVAIWGLETAYGAVMGDHDAIQALATLAWTGRRTKFGRSQLIGALKIIQNGYAPREQLRGSWAGAMGQTQFIPTTYLSYAVDEDGDGRRDIWTNLNDVFASTANYLSVSGYIVDAPWGVEITLPADFDYSEAAPKRKRALAEWAAAGVSGARGDLIGAYDPNMRGRIIVPAGAQGPAFLVFENFEAILKYNRSTSYGLAVGMLSDHVAGRPAGVVKDWPRSDRALALSERKALQQALADQGFNPGPPDGVIGANTKRALRDWQRANGHPADGYASADTLLKVTARQAGQTAQ
ncbi:MAG: lytic murein transglycosylase [Pseudomonadota bacterium]